MHLDLPDELVSRIERFADPRQGLTAAEVVSRAMDKYELHDVPENGEAIRSTRTGKSLTREERRAKYLALRGLVKGVTIEQLIESIHEGRL